LKFVFDFLGAEARDHLIAKLLKKVDVEESTQSHDNNKDNKKNPDSFQAFHSKTKAAATLAAAESTTLFYLFLQFLSRYKLRNFSTRNRDGFLGSRIDTLSGLS